MLKINLGAGRQSHEHPGYVSVDKIKSDGIDILWDCERGLPRVPRGHLEKEMDIPASKVFEDNTVDEFLCKHFLEHLSNDGFLRLMNEMHDALKPGGRVVIHVPNCEHARAAYGDFTHKMRFHITTFDYLTHETLAAYPYTDKEWRIIEREIRGTPPNDLWEIFCIMEPVK